jgi:hypothetical protein
MRSGPVSRSSGDGLYRQEPLFVARGAYTFSGLVAETAPLLYGRGSVTVALISQGLPSRERNPAGCAGRELLDAMIA